MNFNMITMDRTHSGNTRREREGIRDPPKCPLLVPETVRIITGQRGGEIARRFEFTWCYQSSGGKQNDCSAICYGVGGRTVTASSYYFNDNQIEHSI